jgi:opacity protein-like surface antigen
MRRRFCFLVGIFIVLTSSWVAAQDSKFEINGRIGYTFSEGVNVTPVDYLGSEITKVGPSSGFTYGLGFDYFLTEQFSAGFTWSRELSKLKAKIQGLEGVEFANMGVSNYHFTLTYSFFDELEYLRPYVFGGLGATHHSPDSVQGFTINGETMFSTTWGGGIKYYTTDHIGFKTGIRWTPTFIGSDPDGIYCSGYWPWSCFIVSDSSYSHQFELSAGIVVRF